MSVRLAVTIDRLMLAVLGLGLATFTVLYSVVVVGSHGEQTLAVARSVWFVGLAAVVVLSAYMSLAES